MKFRVYSLEFWVSGAGWLAEFAAKEFTLRYHHRESKREEQLNCIGGVVI